MTITNYLDLDTLHLAEGAHPAGSDEMCVMEAVAFVAGEPWSDTPDCASPVIGEFLRAWNDGLPDDARQQLKRYVVPLVGSKGTPVQEGVRAWMALDWLVRDYTPVWLRLAGLTAQADTLAGLPEFVAGMDDPAVRQAISAARDDARAAGDAAWDAAGDAVRAAAWFAVRAAVRAAARAAAGDAARAAVRAAARAAAEVAGWVAAGDAAEDAARDAAWDAAWFAAGDAARAAAWVVVRAAARAAAEDAARAAAGDAAEDAARDAAWDAAEDAGWAAARDALAPAVAECQESAHRLVDRMLRGRQA